MATKYLDSNGLLYLWQKIRNTFVSNIAWDSTNHKLVQKKKTGTSGAEQSSDLVTFSTVATSGSYNDLSNKPTIPTLKNVFGKVKVGSTTIEADTTQDTLELAAGSNVTLTPDTTNDKVTIAATDTTYSAATTSADGLMSSTDKSKLDGIASGAEVNVQSDWSQTSSSADDYIKNKPTSMTPTSHTHGNIQNGGTLQTTDVAIGSGDKLVVTDSSDSNKVARTSLSFDGSTTSKYLSKKGTFEDIPSQVFIAEFGSTSYSEIVDAISDGKMVFACKTGTSPAYDHYIPLSYVTATTAFFWGGVEDGSFGHYNVSTYFYVMADSGNWTEGHSTVVDLTSTQSLSNKTYNGYTLGDACAKGVATSITANSSNLPTVTAVKDYVASAITGAAAFQGTAPTTFAPTNYKKGWYWVVGTAGTYCGQTCEAGDMIFATSDYSSAYSASDFDVIQTNLDITDITNAEIDTIVAS